MSTVRIINNTFESLSRTVKKQASLVVTSPPYNLRTKAKRKITNRRNGGYDLKSFGYIDGYADDMPEAEYQQSQIDFIKFCFDELLKENGLLVYNHKDRRRNGHMISPWEILLQMKQYSIEVWHELIWNRGSTHNHCPDIPTPIHEGVYILKRFHDEGRSCVFNKPSSADGGFDDVFHMPKSPKQKFTDKNGKEVRHCAPFPIDLPLKFISAFSNPGDLICDPYSGSGTTMVAAHKLNRDFIGTETNTDYYNMSIERVLQHNPLDIERKRKSTIIAFNS